jgi:hypothetical protein
MISSFANINPNTSLPPQMIPLSRKTDAWKEDTLNSLENIGSFQYIQNLSLIENYEMVKGKFIFKHYLEQDEYADMVHQLSREFEVPNYLRHYDIISQVINTLSGEFQKRPDNFRVKGFDENTTNNYIREKSRLLTEYVTQEINREIDLRLSEMGFDPYKEDFESPEEQQQYEEEIAQQKQALTPPEIEKYMKYKWQDAAEIWGQHQLELDRHRFSLPEKERKEFEDMLVADRCFRHFYLTSNGYNQETWNPVNTFFHKSPEVDYIEEGDYVGRILFLTIGDVIDRYGHLLTKKQLKKLEKERDVLGAEVGRDGYGIPYGSIVPYANYPDGKLLTDTLGWNPAAPIPTLGEGFLGDTSDYNPFYLNTRGYIKVVEAYWKSQKMIGQICYTDPNTGLLAKGLVDETFVLPEGFTEANSSLYDNENTPGTVCWTWVNETWSGKKICKHGTEMKEDLFFDVKPMPFQFKGDHNPYYCKLPVCGQVFSNRNSQSMSLVDLMKPWQIGFNVAANQLYQIMQREIGRFLIMDVNMLTGMKDWGGENAYEKFLLVAKSLGVTFVDTSPQNLKGANISNTMPRDVDLDESSRMISRAKLMEFFEQRALSQVGITPQRLGNVAASETATGTQQAVTQSFAQTESYFTRFNEYKKRTFKMNLDIAQYVQSKEEDVTITYTKSDMSRAFIKLNGLDLLLADLHVYVSNSQEDVRQLEMLRNLFMTNNNVGATPLDLATVITSNSPAEIKVQLEVAMAKNEEKYQQQMQMEQQKIETEKQIAQAKMEFEAEQNQLDRENELQKAYIASFSRQDDNNADDDASGIPDILEYDKLAVTVDAQNSKLQLEREKQQNEREKFIIDQEMKLRELALKQKELEVRQKIEQEKVKVAKINKNKYDKKSPSKKKK